MKNYTCEFCEEVFLTLENPEKIGDNAFGIIYDEALQEHRHRCSEIQNDNYYCSECGKFLYSVNPYAEWGNALSKWAEDIIYEHDKECYKPYNGWHGILFRSKTLNRNRKSGLLNRRKYIPLYAIKRWLWYFDFNIEDAIEEIIEVYDLPSYERGKLLKVLKHLSK